MSEFTDQLAQDFENVFFNTEEFAQTATYRDPDGDETDDIVIDFDPDGGEEKSGYRHTALVEVMKNQGIVPEYRGVFIVDGQEWVVIEDAASGVFIRDDGVLFQCPVGRDGVKTQW